MHSAEASVTTVNNLQSQKETRATRDDQRSCPLVFRKKKHTGCLSKGLRCISLQNMDLPRGKCCIELAKMGMVRKICLESSMDEIEIRCRCNTTCNFLQDLTCYRGMCHGTSDAKDICVHHLDCLGGGELWCKGAIYIWAQEDFVLKASLTDAAEDSQLLYYECFAMFDLAFP